MQRKASAIEPLVFTTPGGCERHAEGILSTMADAVAREEGRERAAVKAELLEAISLSIARSVAKAIIRRRRPITNARAASVWRFATEYAMLEE